MRFELRNRPYCASPRQEGASIKRRVRRHRVMQAWWMEVEDPRVENKGRDCCVAASGGKIPGTALRSSLLRAASSVRLEHNHNHEAP